MISKTDLTNALIFDIETVSQYPDFDSFYKEKPNLANIWVERNQIKYYDKYKDIPDIDNFIYKKFSGLYPEFSQIVCISMAYIVFDETTDIPSIKSNVIFNKDEKALLNQFNNFLTKFINKNDKTILGGHNITNFDMPVISKRCIINSIKLNPLFDNAGKKPWEIKIIDTLTMWKFGYIDMISLDLLCEVLKIESPKNGIVHGSNVGEMFYDKIDNFEKIKQYCLEDSIATAKVLLKFYEIEHGN